MHTQWCQAHRRLTHTQKIDGEEWSEKSHHVQWHYRHCQVDRRWVHEGWYWTKVVETLSCNVSCVLINLCLSDITAKTRPPRPSLPSSVFFILEVIKLLEPVKAWKLTRVSKNSLNLLLLVVSHLYFGPDSWIFSKAARQNPKWKSFGYNLATL